MKWPSIKDNKEKIEENKNEIITEPLIKEETDYENKSEINIDSKQEEDESITQSIVNKKNVQKLDVSNEQAKTDEFSMPDL